MQMIEKVLSLYCQTIIINSMKRYKVKDILKMLKDDGWYIHSHDGTSHRQFKHPTKKGKVTVRGKESETLGQFLINSIFKQAGWR